MTKPVRSSGFIVFRHTPRRPLFLLIQNAAHTHWDFPKGHIDTGEDKMTSALRELREETGIHSIRTLPGFRQKIHYPVSQEGKTVPKEVTYFLGDVSDQKIRLSEEHSQHKWVPLEEALSLVRFENARRLLTKAAAFLEAPNP